MKLRQLEFVVEIARTGSFRRAAELCHATQPTLSAALAQLEQELGGRLFERTTRKVELTPFGRHIMPYLQSVLVARSEADAAARAFLDPVRKLLRIGISPLADMQAVTIVTDPFRREPTSHGSRTGHVRASSNGPWPPRPTPDLPAFSSEDHVP